MTDTKKKPTYDFSGSALFGVDDTPDTTPATAEPREVTEININLLKPYHNHMFGLYEGARLDEMLASVLENGILVPILVREYGGAYEILSGHNRVNAAKLTGLDTVPARVLDDISDEKADLIVTESNLCQRSFSDLKHSERAFALKTRHDALRSQGKRRDLIDEVEKLLTGGDETDSSKDKYAGRSDVKVAEEFGLSPATITRYIKLAGIDRDLLDLVDNGYIPFSAGAHLAYIDAVHQATVARLFLSDGVKVTTKRAEALRSASNLDEERIREILTGVLTVKKKAEPAAKIKPKVYREYLPETLSVKEVERVIERALKFCRDSNALDELMESVG